MAIKYLYHETTEIILPTRWQKFVRWLRHMSQLRVKVSLERK